MKKIKQMINIYTPDISKYNISALRAINTGWISNLGENIDIVIRSTVPVGFSEKYKCHFMPEFLTEKNWKEDTMNCKEWFIGVDDNSNNVIK
jgi:UDP-glucose 6-dehydrogenase